MQCIIRFNFIKHVFAPSDRMNFYDETAGYKRCRHISSSFFISFSLFFSPLFFFLLQNARAYALGYMPSASCGYWHDNCHRTDRTFNARVKKRCQSKYQPSDVVP